MSTVYVTDDLVGVMWDDRGPVHTISREGEVGEQFSPPGRAVVLNASEDALDEAENGWLEGAIARMRACDVGRKLSKRTLDALAAAIEDQCGEYAGKTT